MGKTKTELFEEKQQAMSDNELIELVQKEISKLAKTGGKSHTMCVPPMITDTDMLLSEMVRRFKKRAQAKPSSVPQANELLPHVRGSLPVYDIDFGGHCKAGIKIENDKPVVIGAMNGWGDGIDSGKIKIVERQ